MDKDDNVTSVAEALPRNPPPVIVDLGSKSRKAIKKLKRGRGKLMADVDQAVEQVRSRLPDDHKKGQFIPLLVVYKKKRKRGKRGSLPCFPLSPFSFLR